MKKDFVFFSGFSLSRSLMEKAVALGLCGMGNGFTVSLYSLLIKEELGLTMLLPTISISGITSGVMFLVFPPIAGTQSPLSHLIIYTEVMVN